MAPGPVNQAPMDHGPVVALILADSTSALAPAREWFATTGFEVGPPAGPTFAVEGDVELFGDALGVRPFPAADGGWTTDSGDEIPRERLPAPLRETVTAVAFERAAELHNPAAHEEEG